ncbi:uncharacterized protein LOC134677799 [Cydia fagiglandana]|uniref:uncharacterized protein LOC134677799 n=1 Tax=Cydia fagiglandana TaxID=1458189 RepID=UPI002FEE2F0F
MKVIIFLLCCVCGNYGENVTTVHFDIRISDDTAHCNPEVINGNGTRRARQVVVETGKNIILNAGLQAIYGHIERANCSYNNGSGPYDLADEYDIQQHNEAWFEEHEVTKSMYGKWSCRLRFNHDTHHNINRVDSEGYTYVLCSITVKNLDSDVSTTPSPAALENKSVMDINNPNLWYIIGGVGIVVLLIIIGQTIALCYFRKKAQPQRRMDKMTPSSTFDRGDRARYSAPPCKKSKEPLPECDRDSHIYELVVVNGNYNKACELAAAVESEASVRSIRDRPPLPLPHEMEPAETIPRKKQSRMASMATNLRLSITGSSNLRSKKKLPPPPAQSSKKAPARPPKQIDEASLPGSLKRPAKPAPASAPASAPAASSAFKPSTIPKNTATESPMSELKNVFKNRNIGIDTATSSPNAAIEKKNPPKVQTKPVQPKQPLIASKPIQPNQMKLILPKIEASLKTPKPINTTISPQKPSLVKKPQPTVSNASQNSKWPPVLTETQQAPKLVPAKQVQKSIQKRPLPKPDARPLPPDPVLEDDDDDDMPIYQLADEDDTPDAEDDEEWTYEPLEQYNIYNM